jgi:hypothetical protein
MGCLKGALERAPRLENLTAEAPRPEICTFVKEAIRKMVGLQRDTQIRESGPGGAGLYSATPRMLASGMGPATSGVVGILHLDLMDDAFT